MDFEIGNETSSDEYIPPAPQFCQRVDEITATNISRGKTGEELFKLGAEIQLKLNQSREKDKQKNLVNMNEQVQLSQILTEYFQLDETAQKARMLDILLELEKYKQINNSISSTVNTVSKQYQDEKEQREELDEQCNNYIKELEDLEVKNEKLTLKIKQYKERNINQNDEFQNMIKIYDDRMIRYDEEIKNLQEKLFITQTCYKIITFVLISIVSYYIMSSTPNFFNKYIM